MADWMRQGCDRCRRGILAGRGDVPVPVAVSLAAHAYLRRCPDCGAWWQVGEREAHVISEDEARQTFADHFRAGEERDQSGDGFAAALHGQLRRGKENLFFSPFSIGQAVGAVLLGAGGDTRAEIAAMLAGGATVPPRTPAGVGLRVTNALWAASDVRLAPTFVERAGREYDAPVATIDFADGRAARDRINGWVAARTQGRIPELIGPGALSPLSRLVLTNAVHFEAAWAFPFPPSRTEPRPFRRVAGGDVAVATMRVTAPLRLAMRDGVTVLTIPYRGGASMVVVLPDHADGLPAAEARLGAGVLGGWERAGDVVPVELFLPRFGSGSSFNLKPALAALGMRRAFDPAAADLRPMTPDPLFIGDVVHQACIRVDEAGTEAAAATAVLAPRGRPAATTAVPVVVDRPFLFLIRGAEGRVLFMGRLTDPAATPG